MRKIGLFLLFLCAQGMLVMAQQPYSQKITVANGLPSESIYSILEDSKGFIWFTCNEGLFRYDGSSFKRYVADKQYSFAGSALQEDVLGRIWYQNFDGECFYVENNQLYALKNYENGIYFEQFSTDKHLFVLEKNSILAFDIKTLNRVKSIELDSCNIVPRSTAFNSNYFYIHLGVLYQIKPDLTKVRLAKLELESATQYNMLAHESGIYIQVLGKEFPEIWEFCFATNSLQKRVSLPEKLVIQNLSYLDQKLWVQTTKGVFLYNPAFPKQLKHYFSEINLSDLLKDRKNNFWFTSPISGIVMVPDFNTNLYDLSERKGLKMIPYGNESWLYSTQNDELVELDLKTGKSETKYKGPSNAQIYYLFDDPSNKNLIFVASDGYSYFVKNGDFNSKVAINDAIKQVVKIDPNTYAYVSSSSFGFIDWSNNSSSSSWIQSSQKDVKLTQNELTVYRKMPNLRCKALLFDPSTKTFYFSSTKSSFVYKNGIFTELKSKQEVLNFTQFIQLENRVFGLTVTGKLVEIKPDLSCVNVSASFGLNDIHVEKIKYIAGYLLLKSKKHLTVLKKKKNAFVLLTRFDIRNQSCFDFHLQKDRILILTNKGIIEWNFLEKVETQKRGTWQINFASMSGKSFKWDKLNEFPASENNLFLTFSILDFGVQTIHKMQYQINNSKWEDIAKDVRTLNFPALSSGKHSIVIRACLLDGTVIEKQISVLILKPFYLTTGFFVLLLLCFLILFVLIFKYRVKQINVRNKLVNEKLNLESNLNKSLLASIKSQMNPHFIFNALNTIQAYIYMNDKKNASGYLSKFSKLTRHILDFSEKEKVQLTEEINALELYLELEKMRFQDQFVYEIRYDKSDVLGVSIPSMLIQPYVENAIKHGLLHIEGIKKLLITFDLNDPFLFVEIDDNGIGRKKSAELQAKRMDNHVSFSSKANELRIQLLNGSEEIGVEIIDKIDSNRQVLGTTVKLKIKI